MIKRNLSLLFLLFTFSFSFSQWIQQTVNGFADFSSLEVISEDTAVAAITSGGYGGNGNINGGNSWDVALQTFAPMSQVSVSNSGFGVLAGQAGMLLKSFDWGQTWTPFFSFPAWNVVDLLAVDSNNIFGLEQSFLFHRTTDGGQNWNTDTLMPWLNAVANPSGNNLLIIGNDGAFQNFPIILRSTDLGLNWDTVFTDSMGGFLNCISFADANNGFVSGYSIILKTSDGGMNWDTVSLTNPHFSAITFESTTTGYGCDLSGNIYRTDDGGLNWVQQIQTFQSLWDIKCASPGICYCVGDSSTVYKTTNGGINGIAEKPGGFHDLIISPNPSQGLLEISFFVESDFADNIMLEILDIFGRVVSREMIHQVSGMNSFRYNHDELMPGIYFVRIASGENIISRKWIKVNG